MSFLSSMTGFARASGEHGIAAWVWEARSVNGRGLDLRIKTPHGFTDIEIAARKAFSAAFTRGNMQISLSVTTAKGQAAYEVDEVWLAKLAEVSALGGQGMSDPAHIPHLMQIDGVVRQVDFAKVITPELTTEIGNSLDELISKLVAARQAEGQALTGMLDAAVAEIENLTDSAAGIAATLPETIKANLDAKFEALLGEKLDADRLSQEAAILAVKADVREELDRLTAHVAQARKLMAQGSPIGRKLDFLSQEFNREINTLCSKSADIDLTQIGLSLKSVNEQFREQAANVE